MAVKGTQHTKKIMSVAARFAAKRENSIQELWSTVLCSIRKAVSEKLFNDFKRNV